MKLHIVPETQKDKDLLVLGLFEEDTDLCGSIAPELKEELQQAINDHQFKNKFGTTYVTRLHDSKNRRILIIALGPKVDVTLDKVRRAVAKGVKFAKSKKFTSMHCNIANEANTTGNFNAKQIGRAVAESVHLCNYEFKKYVSQPEDEPKKSLENIYFQWIGDSSEFDKGLTAGTLTAQATNFSRDLVNEPSRTMTPSHLEAAAREIATLDNVSLQVLNQQDMEQKGMGALLGVSAGSVHPPKFIILRYNGNNDSPYTAIVGKGITFDTGGYNLKPTGYMHSMKCDMSGAAAVLGTIKGLAELKVKKNVIGVVPSCENAVSGSAIKPSDILTAYNKKTIEVTNTDAEGRLILADALSYTEDKFHPEIIIDLATLTGACVVALGEQIAGLMTKDDELAKSLTQAGLDSYDRVWRLPILEEYEDAMKGTISDLKNTGPKGFGAGSITAGVFLSHFVDKARWAHIDIAGPAFVKEAKDYLSKDATGAGVRLLLYYFLNQTQ